MKLSVLPTFQQRIKLWRRYVDDVFAIFEGGLEDVRVFTDEISKIHPNIVFTFEIEQDRNLPFLDLKVKHSNGIIYFDIYRKDTTTSHMIPYNSIHPI